MRCEKDAIAALHSGNSSRTNSSISALPNRTCSKFGWRALANARALHPNFEHVLFGNAEMEEFVREEFPECRAAMASFSQRIQRADFFRYLAVYRLGGFYFDLDVFLARSISPLLNLSLIHISEPTRQAE